MTRSIRPSLRPVTAHDPQHLAELRDEARGLLRDTVGGAVTFALLLALMWAMASLNAGWIGGLL